MSTFHCQYEGHEGSRLVPHPNDRWVKKTTYRRADAAVRKNEVAAWMGNRCTTCMNKEADEIRWIREEQQETLL